MRLMFIIQAVSCERSVSRLVLIIEEPDVVSPRTQVLEADGYRVDGLTLSNLTVYQTE